MRPIVTREQYQALLAKAERSWALVSAGNRGIWPILRSWALASARQR